MCGRYVGPDEAALERVWKVDKSNWNPFSPPRYNVAPTLQVPVIIRAADGTTELTGARWGLIPEWWKSDRPPGMSFNARSEEAAVKPMWRNSLRAMRCIMPAGGWYEWNENEQARNAAGKLANQPYFHYCPGEPVIAIAGLWSTWQRPDANALLSCALMTKDAAPRIAHVHHRMPVILKPEHFTAWLDPRTSAADVQDIIADSREDFACHRVSMRVNSARNDSPELIQPLPAA